MTRRPTPALGKTCIAKHPATVGLPLHCRFHGKLYKHVTVTLHYTDLSHTFPSLELPATCPVAMVTMSGCTLKLGTRHDDSSQDLAKTEFIIVFIKTGNMKCRYAWFTFQVQTRENSPFADRRGALRRCPNKGSPMFTQRVYLRNTTSHCLLGQLLQNTHSYPIIRLWLPVWPTIHTHTHTHTHTQPRPGSPRGGA